MFGLILTLVVNLAILVKVYIDQPLNVILTPFQLNFLIQCLSLNVDYKDDLNEYFHFEKDKPYKLEDGLELEINTHIKKATLQLLDTDETEVAEIQAQGLDIETLFNWNEDIKATITTDTAIISDYDINGNKVPMAHSKLHNEEEESKLQVIVQASVNKAKSVSLYNAKVSLEGFVYTFRLNTLHMLLHVVNLAVPDYEILPYKPYKCNILLLVRL